MEAGTQPVLPVNTAGGNGGRPCNSRADGIELIQIMHNTETGPSRLFARPAGHAEDSVGNTGAP